MSETSVPEAAPQGSPLIDKLKFAGGGLGVGLLLGLLLTGKVMMDKNAAITTAEQQRVGAVKTAKAETAGLQAQLDGAQGQVRALKARVAASESWFEFSRQNYGSAADQLKVARGHLEALDPSVHKVDGPLLDVAKQQAMATDIEVAGDLPAQAQTLRALATSVDKLIK